LDRAIAWPEALEPVSPAVLPRTHLVILTDAHKTKLMRDLHSSCVLSLKTIKIPSQNVGIPYTTRALHRHDGTSRAEKMTTVSENLRSSVRIDQVRVIKQDRKLTQPQER
jgi:hypothetical protein